MKNRKVICVLLAASLVFGIASCSSNDTSSERNNGDRERVTSEAESDEDETSEETTTENVTSTESTEATLREPDGPVESEFFTDFDNMSFTYNGHTYTLGVSTVQDLIDDGVELSGSGNLDEIVDGMSNFYAGFSFELIPYRLATVSVSNFTDEALPASECTISSFRVTNLRELPEGMIGFNFPDMFTKEDLINSAGEPDSTSEFTDSNGVLIETLTYEKPSEIYVGASGYTYTFEDGIIDTINMSYMI